MADTLYFLFLDEIYTPNLNEFRRRKKEEIFAQVHHHHFGIAGVIVAASQIYDLYAKARRIKTRYFPRKDKLIFHYTDTLHKREEFQELATNQKKFLAFTASLRSFIQNSEFKYLSVFIDKHELIKKYASFDRNDKAVRIKKIGSNLFPKSKFMDYNLYLLCLRQLLVSFFQFISDHQHQARGVVVAEARGKKEDDDLRSAFHKIYYCGVSTIRPTDFRRKIIDLFIVPKSQDYIGTQLADMMIYPTYDSQVPNHSSRQDHFIDFDRLLKRKLKGKISLIPDC